MLVCRLFRDDYSEHQIDWRIVRRLEFHGLIEPDETTDGCIEVIKPGVGYGKAIAQSSTTESFTIEKVIVDRGLGQI